MAPHTWAHLVHLILDLYCSANNKRSQTLSVSLDSTSKSVDLSLPYNCFETRADTVVIPMLISS